MVNQKFRKAIQRLSNFTEQEIIILNDPAYDNSIVGITDEGRLIYDLETMVEEHIAEMDEEEFDSDSPELDALDEIIYNTLNAIPNFGDRAPIVIGMSYQDIIDKYGDDD